MFDPLFDTSSIQHFHNKNADARREWPADLDAVINREIISEAVSEIKEWSTYSPTALHVFDSVAKQLGLGTVYYKDESARFGLGSFKALGGAYAVLCLLRKEVSRRMTRVVSFEEIHNGAFIELIRGITVATATDGNHGRSVA